MLGLVGGGDSSRRVGLTASRLRLDGRRRASREPGAPSADTLAPSAWLFVALTLSLNGAPAPVLSLVGETGTRFRVSPIDVALVQGVRNGLGDLPPTWRDVVAVGRSSSGPRPAI